MKRTGTAHAIIPKDLRAVAKRARRAGWTITVARSGHLHWCTPDGKLIVTGTSPSKTGIRLARLELEKELSTP